MMYVQWCKTNCNPIHPLEDMVAECHLNSYFIHPTIQNVAGAYFVHRVVVVVCTQ
jgi:hypothetical protein